MAPPQESRLKAEISEYVVTESIEEQFRKLLDRMQLAMESGGENEIGVWVSGFYGRVRARSPSTWAWPSTTSVTVNGIAIHQAPAGPPAQAPDQGTAETVAQRFPAAVVMLDLASEMLAGATMEDVSTVLYLQGAAVGRLLPEPQGRRLGAARREGWPHTASS